MEVTSTPKRRWSWNQSWKERWEDMRRPLAILLALVYGVLLFFSFSWSRCFFDGCPNVETLAVYQPGGAPVLLDRRGEAFADLAPSERDMAPLSSLPSHVAQAFLAVEDKRFYEHRGVDWHRVGGAIFANLRSGEYAQGFSTISMQLARNVFPERISGQEQTTRRKLIEVRVAQEIERRYSKQEILELYLNNIYFGNRARGIEAAARQYFGRPAKELSLEQAALLAALPKAPSHYDPRRHPEKALERRNLVLDLMRDQGRVPASWPRWPAGLPWESSGRRARSRWRRGLPPTSWSRSAGSSKGGSGRPSTPSPCGSSPRSIPTSSGPPRRSCAGSSSAWKTARWACSRGRATPWFPRHRRTAPPISRARS